MGLVETNEAVEEPVEGLTSGDDGMGVESFVRLGKGIEETPGVSGSELVVRRSSPLVQHLGDLGGGDGPAIDRFDDEVVGFRVAQGAILISGDALIETTEPVAQLTHCPRGEMTQVTDRKAGVFATDLDLTGEGEVVATEDASAGDEAGRERFVMAVAQSDDPMVVLDRVTGKTHLEDAEVAIARMTERMGFRSELEAGTLELPFDLLNEIAMRQGIPGLGGHGSGRVEDDLTVDGFGAAVKEHALGGGRSRGDDRFNGLYHDVG